MYNEDDCRNPVSKEKLYAKKYERLVKSAMK